MPYIVFVRKPVYVCTFLTETSEFSERALSDRLLSVTINNLHILSNFPSLVPNLAGNRTKYSTGKLGL